MFSREPEGAILQTVREFGMAFVSYSPLSRGILSAQISRDVTFSEGDSRLNMPRYQGDNFDHNLAIVEQLDRIARDLGTSPAQLALAWVLAQGDDIVTIPGTRRIDRLEENVAAAEISLSAGVLAEVAAVLDGATVAGDRYHAGGMQQINR